MGWSEKFEHDGSGYPAPLGTRCRVQFAFGNFKDSHIGASGTPEFLSGWTWKRVDGSTICYGRSLPIIWYQLWIDNEQKQVDALREMITPEKLAEFSKDKLIPEPQ